LSIAAGTPRKPFSDISRIMAAIVLVGGRVEQP
jgi:hypothetical protein